MRVTRTIDSGFRADRVGRVWPVLYALAWLALDLVAATGWFLPAGLRLAALVSLPRRHWWRLALAEGVAIGLIVYWERDLQSWLASAVAAALAWCVYAGAVRGFGCVPAAMVTPPALRRALAAGLVASIANGVLQASVTAPEGTSLFTGIDRAFSAAFGDLVGIVTMMPLVLVLQEHWRDRSRLWSITTANGAVLLPTLALVTTHLLPLSPTAQFLWLLATISLVWIAQSNGWRAIAASLGLLGIVCGVVEMAGRWHALSTAAHPSGGPDALWIASLGGASLLLAAKADAVRIERLAVRTQKDRLWLQSQQLRAAVTRLASEQEQERRRIGAELHDALGQDMTAIATRLRLLQRRPPGADLGEELSQLRDLVSDAHGHLRDAINQLHPATVTRFGLTRALTIGPVAEMLRAGAVRYECQVHGPVDRLPPDVATMLYRIAQEAATNAVRHGCGGFLRLDIAVDASTDAGELRLDVTDHAGELDVPPERLGHGLQSIRDRADALGADYLFNARSGLPRHRLRMNVALARTDDQPAASRAPALD